MMRTGKREGFWAVSLSFVLAWGCSSTSSVGPPADGAADTTTRDGVDAADGGAHDDDAWDGILDGGGDDGGGGHCHATGTLTYAVSLPAGRVLRLDDCPVLGPLAPLLVSNAPAVDQAILRTRQVHVFEALAVSPGQVTVQLVLFGAGGQTTYTIVVDVVASDLERIDVQAAPAMVKLYERATLRAIAHYADGATDNVTSWASFALAHARDAALSGPVLADPDPKAGVLPVVAGAIQVNATLVSVGGQTSIDVDATTDAVDVTIGPPNYVGLVGDPAPAAIGLDVHYATGDAARAYGVVAWTSANTAVLQNDADLPRCLAAGTTTVTFVLPDRTLTADVSCRL